MSIEPSFHVGGAPTPESWALFAPAIALILWTMIVWLWMYITRIPAMQRARIDAGKIKHKEDLHALPTSARQVADNYNHLHEQPTLFYAVILISALIGMTMPLQVQLAWAYVGLRVAHSLWQGTINYVPVRFVLFTLGTIVLGALAAHVAIKIARGLGWV